jgi:hypothetical protein
VYKAIKRISEHGKHGPKPIEPYEYRPGSLGRSGAGRIASLLGFHPPHEYPVAAPDRTLQNTFKALFKTLAKKISETLIPIAYNLLPIT